MSVDGVTDRLRPLWDFDDLDASERRFRTQLEQETSDPSRAEVLTQLARVEGLRGNFEQSAQLLDKAEPLAGSSAVANVRLELERGRMFRSNGDPEAAFPVLVTTSRLLSTGVDAQTCRLIVLDRPVESMTEFNASWDPDLAAELMPEWFARKYIIGSLMDVNDLVHVVHAVLHTGPSACIHSLVVAPRPPSG